MASVSGQLIMQRISEIEIPLCRFCHHLGALRTRRFFSLISKIGDGHYGYALALLVLLFEGLQAWPAIVQVMAVFLCCHVAYRRLKNGTARPRPFDFAFGFDLAVAPLDKYSFPSGHTLHAVAFAVVMVTHFSWLAWILLPFAFLVALSRVVLGLHYPTDVVAGALLGLLIAWLSFQI